MATFLLSLFSRFKFIRDIPSFSRNPDVYRPISTTVDPNAVLRLRWPGLNYASLHVDDRRPRSSSTWLYRVVSDVALDVPHTYTHTHGFNLPSPPLTVHRPFLRYPRVRLSIERSSSIPRSVKSRISSSRESFLLISNNRVHRLLTGTGVIRVRSRRRFVGE